MKIKYIFLTIWTFALPISTAFAQDSIYARSVIETLSSPEFHGRGYAFKGDSIAADFIGREFAEFRLKTWTRDYLQLYNISTTVFEGNTKIDFGENYSSSSLSDAMQIFANSAPAKGEFKVISATNKMLKAKMEIPEMEDNFIAIDYYSDNKKNTKWNQIVSQNTLGAKGYILLNEKSHKYSPRLGCIKISHTIISLLKDSVSETLKNLSIDLDSRYIRNYTTQNVCGYVEGKLYPDTFFVVGAHYDHLGQIGTNYIFPGANDNASGVAMILDLAKYFSRPENKPDYSIAFLAFSSEEIGLLGSFYFVENSPIPMENIKVMLNLDMVGTGEDGFLFIGGQTFADEFSKFTNINTEKKYIEKLLSRESSSNSDHYPFFKKGCKAMFIHGMGKSGKYHHPSDTLENLSLGGYTNLYKLLIDYINSHNIK